MLKRLRRLPSGDQAGSSLLGSLLEVVFIVGAAFVLALLIQQFVVKPFYIPSESMEPTLVKGDRVLVNRFVYRFNDPKPGDVIVFHPPTAPEQDYIKRVVAVGGDTVEVKGGLLFVNGVAQDEPYLNERNIEGVFPSETVPEGYVFAMGDNRNRSSDSRVFGPVKLESILGKGFVIYWPPGKIGWL
ncbi:MAG TPA: signal peptidase I [Thermoleophilia bacterium]|nr:signal peptidase I [Thermoleophilia bacterium]